MVQRTANILVVDDDKELLELLKRILQAAGFVVRAAQSPVEGRALLEQEPPQIILTDLSMEPEDGFSFIQSIRNQSKYSKIPILVLSGLNDYASVKKALSLRVSDYVIKPLQPHMLLKKLRKVLYYKESLRIKFPEDAQVCLMGDIECSVGLLGETGYKLGGPFKLKDGEDIDLEIPEFKELGLNMLAHKISPVMKTYLNAGTFLNDITLIGVNEGVSHKIRQYVTKQKK